MDFIFKVRVSSGYRNFYSTFILAHINHQKLNHYEENTVSHHNNDRMSITMQKAMGGGNMATLQIKERTRDLFIQMVSFNTPNGLRTDYQHYIKISLE
jgi:hypothetical protein